MVRTKDSNIRTTVAKAPRKAVYSSSNKKKVTAIFGTGNRVCPRETPPWQKSITQFCAETNHSCTNSNSYNNVICDVRKKEIEVGNVEAERINEDEEKKNIKENENKENSDKLIQDKENSEPFSNCVNNLGKSSQSNLVKLKDETVKTILSVNKSSKRKLDNDDVADEKKISKDSAEFSVKKIKLIREVSEI